MKAIKFFPFFIFMFTCVRLKASDTLTIKIKLLNVSKVLTFNQSHVPGGLEEYRWEVLVDSDNNIYTGNTEGYDVGFVLRNTKLPGSISYTGTIISGSEQHTILYSGNSWTYGNELTVYFGDNDSTLHIKAMKSYPEVANIAQGCRMMSRTFYYSDGGILNDETTSCFLPGLISDQQGDVTEDFIDILSVGINQMPTGVNEEEKTKSNTLFYPNPGTGKIFITGKKPVTILSCSGEKLYSGDHNEIDLSEFSPGVYLIREDKTGKTQKLILSEH